MGQPLAGRPDRAHERRDRAVRGRTRRTIRSHGTRRGVRRDGTLSSDDAASARGGVPLEVLEAPDDEDFGLDAGGRRADAVAETEHRQRVMRRARRSPRSRGRAPISAPRTGSVCTFSRPSRFISDTAHSIARSSCGDPLSTDVPAAVSVNSASRCHVPRRSRRAAASSSAMTVAGASVADGSTPCEADDMSRD